MLGRAAADQPAAEVLLERVLPLLEQVVAGLPADVGVLTAISAAIPYPLRRWPRLTLRSPAASCRYCRPGTAGCAPAG